MRKRFFITFISGFCLLMASSQVASACATCFGAADSPQTKAMNMAILFLLAVTGGVLGGILAFVIYLRKRAKMMMQAEALEAELPKIRRDHRHSQDLVSTHVVNGKHVPLCHAPSGVSGKRGRFSTTSLEEN